MASKDAPQEPPLNSTYDWDLYAQYRPSYPPSLTKLIMDYHRAHSNSLRLAHDIGAGSGSYSQTLSPYFQHIHISDPNLSNLQHARQRLSDWHRQNWWTAKFSFSQGRAEEADLCVAEGSVDLCVLMMSAHWCGEGWVDAVARSLSPNGTLAVVQYNPCPTVIGNEVVAKAVRELYAIWGKVVAEGSSQGKGLIEKNNSPLDWIYLGDGDSVFIQDVTKRIKINTHGKGDGVFVIPGQEGLVAESRVGNEQRKYWYDEGNSEAEGWREEVGKEWFRGNLLSLQQEGNMHLFEETLREVERLIKETTENGRVTIEWAVAVLLATRK